MTRQSGRAEGRQRLFFALWPQAALRQGLGRLAGRYAPQAGRPVSVENLHLTLVFLGAVDTATRACLEAGAGRLRCPPFRLTLDRLGGWRGPGVLWLGPSTMPPGLVTLVEALRGLARDCGVEVDARPYRAHVTVARKLRERVPEAELVPLDWPAEELVLVRSRTLAGGPEYTVLRAWRLQAP